MFNMFWKMKKLDVSIKKSRRAQTGTWVVEKLKINRVSSAFNEHLVAI